MGVQGRVSAPPPLSRSARGAGCPPEQAEGPIPKQEEEEEAAGPSPLLSRYLPPPEWLRMVISAGFGQGGGCWAPLFPPLPALGDGHSPPLPPPLRRC